MRRFYQQGYSKFSYQCIVKETELAKLLRMKDGVSIWIPNSWFTKLGKSIFTVKDHLAVEIKLKIQAEHNAIKNEKR